MTKTRSILSPYEIDLYDEEKKFGIEFNGNYWHSEQKGISRRYHQKKSLYAEEKGIFLYHIWEYEWNDPLLKDIILSQIQNIADKNRVKFYARRCEIRLTSSTDSKLFLTQNHLQGYCSSKVNLGLYHENELVSLMTFGKPRFNKNYEWELLRFCTKKNTSIIGGASKLFKKFVELYKPKSVLSYSRIDKGTGRLYENLGFKLDKITDPDYVWTNGKIVLSRYQCQKHKLIQQGFKGSSESEIMENRNFLRVFGCGNKVWVWNF